MTTVADLISLALRDSGVLGVGQAGDAQDVQDAFVRLNMMLAQWSRKRWLVYHLIDVSVQATGAQTYSVGPGGDFNCPRPDRLEAAYVRQPNNAASQAVDFPLKLIEAREDYSRLAVKALGNFPAFAFYDSGFPLGALYPWPMASSLYQLHIVIKDVLSAFTDIGQTVNLPPEYVPALHYGLCARLRPAYGKGPDPTVTALAADALATIRQANTQISRLRMPKGLNRGGVYWGPADRVL